MDPGPTPLATDSPGLPTENAASSAVRSTGAASIPPAAKACGRPRYAPQDEVFPGRDFVGDLARQSVRGGAATLGAQVFKFALSAASNVILVRLLTPRDFGLVAMAVAVTMLGSLVKDLGLSISTIQRERVTHEQVSALFWLNATVASLLGIALVLASPYIATFYGEPEVRPIVMCLALTVVIGGLTSQHHALLQRQMRFSLTAAIGLTSQALATTVAIIAALLGAGYWSIVLLAVMEAFLTMMLSWARSNWRPGRPGDWREVRNMAVAGSQLTGFNILTFVGRQADDVLLGWRWGADPLGLYTRAYALLLLPLNQINSPMGRIALPVLSRLQGEPAEFRRYYARALNLVNYLALPLVGLMGVLAEPAVVAVLGREWADAGPIFAILAVAAIGQPSLYTMMWVTLSRGEEYKQLRWSLVTAPVLITAFCIGLPWGPKGVALAYAVAVSALTLPGLAYAYRGSPIGLSDAWDAVRRPVMFTIVISVAASLGARASSTDTSPWLVLASGLAAAAVAMALTVTAWPGLRAELRSNVMLIRHLRRSDPEQGV